MLEAVRVSAKVQVMTFIDCDFCHRMAQLRFAVM